MRLSKGTVYVLEPSVWMCVAQAPRSTSSAATPVGRRLSVLAPGLDEVDETVLQCGVDSRVAQLLGAGGAQLTSTRLTPLKPF